MIEKHFTLELDNMHKLTCVVSVPYSNCIRLDYTYSNVNITSNSIVDVVPDNSSYSIVSSAQLLPRVDSSNGSIKLYSNKLPTGDFTVTIIINKN